jgi:hypothetical protein
MNEYKVDFIASNISDGYIQVIKVFLHESDNHDRKNNEYLQ